MVSYLCWKEVILGVLRIVLPVLFAASLAGCAPGSHYLGIDLRVGARDPELQQLAARARSGGRREKLELGILFEEGRGVPRDVAVARRLYEDAVFSEELMDLIVLPEASQGQIPVVIPYVARAREQVKE